MPKRKTSLSHRQAQAVVDGAEAAIDQGIPPNRFITINWEQAGVADPVGATGQFLKFLQDALRKTGHKTAHVWVQEPGAKVGQHAHILVHIPRRLLDGSSACSPVG